MSRKGYANLEQEMVSDHETRYFLIFLFKTLWVMLFLSICFVMQIESDPSMEIDRSDTWIQARHDEDGNFQNDEVKQIAEDIVSYSFFFEWNIWTKALSKLSII